MIAPALLLVTLAAGPAYGKAERHVCPPGDPPPVPVQPQGAPSAGSGEEPVQLLGCLNREYPLQDLAEADAEAAVGIAEEPTSRAVVRRFRNISQRDTAIAAWIGRWSDVRPLPFTVTISGAANIRWALADGSSVFVLYPADAKSGRICLGRANTAALRDALPILNNWCMDRLRLWAR